VARTLSAGFLLLAAAAAVTHGAQSGSGAGGASTRTRALLGIWRVSEQPPGETAMAGDAASVPYIIFTASHYRVIATQEQMPLLADAVQADADGPRAMEHRLLHSGTYVVHAGNQLAFHATRVEDPVAAERWLNLLYEVEGDSLKLRDRHGRVATFVRVK
jgi:hypothetical protein